MKKINTFYDELIDDMLEANDEDFSINKQEAVSFMKGLFSAIIKNKKVTLVGDYDPDGLFSAIILETQLKILESRVKNTSTDFSNVDLVFSDRSDGYEMPYEKFKEIKQDGVVVFLDTGSSYEYIKREESEDVFVVDHHPLKNGEGQLNSNIFNPNKDGKLSTSAGRVMYEMCNAFEEELFEHFAEKGIKLKEHDGKKHMKALAGISLLADMANFDDYQNRIFLKESLEILNNNRQKFVWLSDIKSREITSTDLSFNLINYINSYSRMNKNLGDIKDLFRFGIDKKGELVYLTSSDKAKSIFKEMKDVHTERKKITAELESTLSGIIESERLGSYHDSNVEFAFVVIDNRFSGINGLLSNFLYDRTKKPSVVVSWDEARGKYIGSGRGYGVKQCVEQVVDALDTDEFVKCGGHYMACGVSIEKDAIDHFKTASAEAKSLDSKKLTEEKFYVSEDILSFHNACMEYANIAGGVSRSTRYYAVLENYQDNGFAEKNNGWYYALLSDKTGVLGLYLKEDDLKTLQNKEPICLEITQAREDDDYSVNFIQHKHIPSIEVENKNNITLEEDNMAIEQINEGVKI